MSHPRASARTGSQEERVQIDNVREGDMEILLIAAGAIAAIWFVVLWGSRYLGPQ